MTRIPNVKITTIQQATKIIKTRDALQKHSNADSKHDCSLRSLRGRVLKDGRVVNMKRKRQDTSWPSNIHSLQSDSK